MTIISAIVADEIEKRREPIVLAMARALARPDGRTASDQHTRLASALLEATLAALRNGAQATSEIAAEIDRNSAACFGDSLLPILKDVIGPGLPPSSLSRVSDAYWQMIKGVGVTELGAEPST